MKDGQTKTKAEEKREHQEALNDIIQVMKLPAGRRWIWRILETSRVFGSVYSADANTTYFREGQRNLGLLLMGQLIEANPALFLQMQSEHYILSEPETPAKDE